MRRTPESQRCDPLTKQVYPDRIENAIGLHILCGQMDEKTVYKTS